MPASPQPAPYVPSTGYKRSASVTAAVDFFEQRARSVSASSLADKARSSPQASPRPSISAEAGPGPSSQTSPRLRGSGLPKASSARGRSTASPSVPLPGRSGRASLDSAASPGPKPPVGLGMRGVGAAEVNGTRRASETALLAASTGSSAPSTTSRLRQPQAGVRSSLSAESTSSPQKPSAIGMRRTGTSSSTEAGPSRTSTPPMPRSGSAARLANGAKTPSPRIGPSSSGTFGSPRRTPASPASRIPTRTATRTSASASSSASPSTSRAPVTARQPLAPTVSISHATPEGSRIPKSASSVSVARSTPLNGSANASSASLSSGPGSRGMSLGLSPSARSQSYSSHLSSAHSSASLSGRGTPSRTDVVLLDTEDEKELPPLPTHDTDRPRTGPPIAIPKRHSSAASPSSPTSPTLPSSSFSSHNGQPIISPRQSSKHAFDDEVPSPTADVPSHPAAPIEPARRASQTILLGEIPPSTRQRPRFDPGLTIEPPPSLAGMQSLSASRPSPPIPAKSPLRSLSRASSTGRRSSGVHSRVVSRDSTFSSIYGDAEAGSESAITATATTDSTAGTSDSTTAVVGQVAHDARADSPPDMPTSADVELTPQTRYFYPSADVDAYHAKRLMTMTYASSYSQDSRPSSAVAVVNMGEFGMLSEGECDGERRVRRQSRMDDLWGRSNRSISEKSPGSDTFSPSLPSPLTTILPNRQTDSPDSSALNTATTTSDISRHAITGHSPHVARLEVDEPPRPIRSPSAPMLNGMASDPAQPAAKAAKLLGIDSAVRPTRSNLPAPLLPSAMTRSPTAPVISPRTPSSLISKRTHLIREIANTERGFATDLALIRDAYLGQYLRPTSVSSGGESFSGSSRRGSNTTTTDNRRSSGTDWTLPTPPAVSPFPRSPSEGVYSGGQGYFTSTNLAATASTTSLKQPSPGMKSAGGGGGAMMAPPVGKPLSPADARTVFLNLEQLAAGAEEMARGFEGAMGEEEVGPGFVAREGEAGSDRLGEVFMSLIPRLRPVYHYYCSRQESASSRLQELLSDSSTAAHLNGCWAQVKPHTHAWNLDSMLIKPVQRITKYPLLFEDLLACTTPVHSDYFNIRAAAELSRKIALEIDEAKRRKDVVANAISTNKKPKTPKTSLPSPVKDKKGLDFKMFRKEKLPAGMSPSASSVNLAMDAPPEITRTSSALLKDLVGRVDEGAQVVRRVGKEIILWTAGSKEMIVAEGALMSTWAGVVRLDADRGAGAGADDRIAALQAILEGIVRGPWAILNDEIRDQVMPIFSKLLDTVVNPRKVIAKHQAKASDYSRYIQLVKAKRTPERAILLSALDFYALHSQLLDELPAFLEGYMRILDLGLTAFAAAQAKYYDAVRTRLNEFANRWIARPRHSPQLTFALRRASEDVKGAGSHDAEGADGSTELDSLGASADLKTGRGIVKAWYEAWTPYADAMDHFQCTRPAKAMVSRIASFNARSNSRPSSRPTSRVSSPAPTGASPGLTPARPGLQHSVSFSSRSRNSSGSSQLSAGANSAHARSRSTSLLGSAPGSGSTTFSLPAPLPSPLKESRFNPFRSGSKTPKSAQSTPRTSRPSSLHIPGDASANPNRYSFGLPRIEQEPGLDGLGKLGVSPTNRLRMSPAERMIALGSLSVQDVAKDPGANGRAAEFRAVSDPSQYASEEAEEDSPSLGRQGRPGAQNTGPARAGVLTALVERSERPERPPRPESRTGRSSSTDSGVPFPSSPPRRRSSAATAMAGLGLGDVEAHPVDSTRRTSGRSVVSTQSTVTSAPASPSDETRRERTDRRPVRAHAPPPPSAFPASASMTLGTGFRSSSSARAGSGHIAANEGVPPPSPSREKSRYTPGSGNEIDAAEGWRSEPVLYRCACVADFDPTEIGDSRYRGLRFLPMLPGDMLEVFHEVGRIDELPKFPYPEVGVDNDGVLVGRAEDGAIGLLICSFLQPLQE